MDDRLWDYLDGRGNAAERSSIEELIAQNSAWKEKYRELLDVHALMQGSELDMPSMRFSKNVMEEIAKLHIAPATRTYINNKIIWGLSLFFITMLIGFLIYGIGQVNQYRHYHLVGTWRANAIGDCPLKRIGTSRD